MIEQEYWNWFYAETIEELDGEIRYEYGRRFFAARTQNETVLVGLTIPNDTSDSEETKLVFENIGLYESPVFEIAGYLVVRLPPVEAMKQLHDEAVENGGVHPSVTVRDETDLIGTNS